MSDLPPVSFVIPAFNAGSWLADAVNSIFDGNFNTEQDQLIIVNDGSTDNTGDVAGLAIEKYDRATVVCITNPVNIGCAESRNIGNRKSRHDLIFALDADNILVPGSVAALRRLMQDSHNDAAAFRGIKFFRGRRTNVTGSWIFPERVTPEIFFSRHDLPTSGANYLYRKRLWERFPHPAGVGAMEAWTWGLRIMMGGARFVTDTNGYYLHRQGIESLWIRDNRVKNFDMIATEQLKPYLDRVADCDQYRVSTPVSRWYTDLDHEPVRLKNGN